MRKVFGIAMLIVGTIIGAGFASGKEIVAFFGNKISVFTPLIVGIGVAVISYVMLTVADKTECQDISSVNARVLGAVSPLADCFLLINNLIVLGGMMSGMNSLLDSIYPLPFVYAVVSGILCVLVVMNGVKGILNCNIIIVPVIIACITAVCLSGKMSASYVTLKPLASAKYVAMNMVLAATVLTTAGKSRPLERALASLIAGAVVGTLMLLIVLRLGTGEYLMHDMPLVGAAGESKVMGIIMLIAIAVSIFTTMMTAMTGFSQWLGGITLGRRFPVIVTFLAGLIVAAFGFANVVQYLYPLIGLVGILYLSALILFVVLPPFRYTFFYHSNRKVHNRRKQTQNNG